MTEVEEFKKLLEKFELEYYKNNFEGKKISDSIYEAFKKEVLELTCVYVRFGLLGSSLTKISKDSDVHLSEKDSELLNTRLNCVDYAVKKLNKILGYITDSLNA